MRKDLKEYVLIWAPFYGAIGRVWAKNAQTARRKAPQPYRKYLGEIAVMTSDQYDAEMESLGGFAWKKKAGE